MNNLFEILQNAQGGEAMANLAKQFSLTQEQTRAAVEALLPAFSFGLKNQAAAENPFAALTFQHLDAFNNASAAFTDQAVQQGQQMVSTLFGSTDAGNAVAAQAAALSGVGQNVLKAMLPVIASILMSGLMKSAATHPSLQDIFGQMMGSMMGGTMPGTANAGGGLPGNLGDILGGMLRAGQAAQPNPQVQPNANGGGLLGAILGSLLQQGAQQAKPAQAAPNPGDVFGQMFNAGAQVQKAHADAMQSILEGFWGKK